jgi:hypothetical protein
MMGSPQAIDALNQTRFSHSTTLRRSAAAGRRLRLAHQTAARVDLVELTAAPVKVRGTIIAWYCEQT